MTTNDPTTKPSEQPAAPPSPSEPAPQKAHPPGTWDDGGTWGDDDDLLEPNPSTSEI